MEITAELWNKIILNSLSIRSHDKAKFKHSNGTEKITPEKGVAAYGLCHEYDKADDCGKKINSDWAKNDWGNKLLETINVIIGYIGKQETRYLLFGKGYAGTEWEYKGCLPKVNSCYFEIFACIPITQQSNPGELKKWVLNQIKAYPG